MKFYIQSFLSGLLIAAGDTVYVLNDNKILGAFLFSMGLLSIIIKGYPLYTGRIVRAQKRNVHNEIDVFCCVEG